MRLWPQALRSRSGPTMMTSPKCEAALAKVRIPAAPTPSSFVTKIFMRGVEGTVPPSGPVPRPPVRSVALADGLRPGRRNPKLSQAKALGEGGVNHAYPNSKPELTRFRGRVPSARVKNISENSIHA